VSARNVGEDAHAHCQALVRASDPDRFVATLFAPADRRAYMFALYAFNLEIARIGEIAHEPLAGEIRLQWWRDALTGVSHCETSGHPVASALLGALESCRLPVQPLLNLIEARRFDIYQEPMVTSADLDLYVRQTSSAVFATAGQILAGRDREIAEAADVAGLAYGKAMLLSVAPLHATHGRIYMPSDILDRHGAKAQDLLGGRSTPALQAAFAEVGSHAGGHFHAFLEHAQHLPANARAAFLPVAIVPLLLKRLRRRRSVTHSVVDVAPLSRLIALGRAGWLGFSPP